MSKERIVEACEWTAALGWIVFCVWIISETR